MLCVISDDGCLNWQQLAPARSPFPRLYWTASYLVSSASVALIVKYTAWAVQERYLKFSQAKRATRFSIMAKSFLSTTSWRFGGNCHSFYLFCLFRLLYIHNHIHMHPSPFAEASLHFLHIACLLSRKSLLGPWGAESRFELGPAIQQASRTIHKLSYAAPCVQILMCMNTKNYWEVSV